MSKLAILTNKNFCAEKKWVINTVFNELLKVSLAIEVDLLNIDNEDVTIKLNQRSLTVNGRFFLSDGDDLITKNAIPVLPLQEWDLANENLKVNLLDNKIPVLYGNPGFHLDNNNNGYLKLDIFGSAFFMLSRYEEMVVTERDNHDRFPATASIAYKAGFLDRPIVDEYIEILWAAMQLVWPELKRKKQEAKTIISCDVDAPYSPGVKSGSAAIRHVAGDIIKRKSPNLAIRSMHNFLSSRLGDYRHDPYDTFEWIMDENEKQGNQVAFYFICDHSADGIDGCYTLEEPRIRKLMCTIRDRGHEIGMHGSYNTYNDREQLIKESNILRKTMQELNIKQNQIGNRQHFLRWQPNKTAQYLDAAGFGYDSTLSFADRPGFRCGTCHEYPMFDFTGRRTLNLRQRPLIAMECSVIAGRYMGLGYSDEAMSTFLNYKQISHKFNGNFTLLWHNSHLTTEKDKAFYLELIK